MEVGKRIRAVRQQRGMSLRDLAHRSGVSKAYLSQLENDPGRRPSVDVVVRIAEALGVSVLELLDRGEAGDAARSGRQGFPAGTEPAGTAATGSGAASPHVGASRRAGAGPGGTGSATAPAGRPSRERPGQRPPAPSGATGDGAGQAQRTGDDKPLDPEELPPALRLFWEEHPYVTEEEIRSLANINWCGRRPFTPTDYWVLHQVLSGMLRDT